MISLSRGTVARAVPINRGRAPYRAPRRDRLLPTRAGAAAVFRTTFCGGTDASSTVAAAAAEAVAESLNGTALLKPTVAATSPLVRLDLDFTAL